MSKRIKELISKEIAGRMGDTSECIIANVIGLDSQATYLLRKRLRQKNIHLLVVRNSLARRATEGTPLAPALTGLKGPAAVLWGAEDFVALAKEVVELDGSAEFEAFQARAGVMDGQALTAERIKEISRWPSRQEQLSILVGQILSPGAKLQSQLLAPAGQLASQLKKIAERDEGKPTGG